MTVSPKATAPAPIVNRHVTRARKVQTNKAMRNLMSWLNPSKPVSATAHKLPRPQRKPAPTVKKPLSLLDQFNVALSQLEKICQVYGIPPHEIEKLTVPQVEALLQSL